MNKAVENLFISYEIAKKLKEIGYDEPCIAWYLPNKKIQFGLSDDDGIDTFKNSESTCHNSLISAPSWQQCIDWLRDNHKIIPLPQVCSNGTYLCRVVKNEYPDYDLDINNSYHNTFYEAFESSILKALDLIK